MYFNKKSKKLLEYQKDNQQKDNNIFSQRLNTYTLTKV